MEAEQAQEFKPQGVKLSVTYKEEVEEIERIYKSQKDLITEYWMLEKRKVLADGGIWTDDMKEVAKSEALRLYPKEGDYVIEKGETKFVGRI